MLPCRRLTLGREALDDLVGSDVRKPHHNRRKDPAECSGHGTSQMSVIPTRHVPIYLGIWPLNPSSQANHHSPSSPRPRQTFHDRNLLQPRLRAAHANEAVSGASVRPWSLPRTYQARSSVPEAIGPLPSPCSSDGDVSGFMGGRPCSVWAATAFHITRYNAGSALLQSLVYCEKVQLTLIS